MYAVMLERAPYPIPNDGLSHLSAELTKLDFTELSIKRRFGLPDSDEALTPMQRPLLDFRGQGDTEPALDLLIQLFIVGCAVRRGRMEAVLSPQAVATMLACRMVEVTGDTAIANLAIVPWRGLLVASDRVDAMFHPDYVLFLNPTVPFMSPFVAPAPGEPAGHALDVGCGCGVLSMLAARHYAKVTAIDISERAVHFTAFNAALNGLAIEARTCTPTVLRDGVYTGMDLVMFNIPTVYQAHFISRTYAFRSEMGEQLLVDSYAGAPGLLGAKGRCVYSHQIRTQPPAYFEELLAGAGCAEHLSVTWLSGGPLTPIGYTGLEWGISIVTRRAQGAPFFRRIPAWQRLGELDRDAIARHLRSQELAAGPTLATAIPMLTDIQIARTARVSDGRLVEDDTGMCRGTKLTAAELDVLRAIDGRTNVSDLAVGHSEQTHALVRQLVEHGFVALREP
jgi:SAM-dependent methyltransferase